MPTSAGPPSANPREVPLVTPPRGVIAAKVRKTTPAVLRRPTDRVDVDVAAFMLVSSMVGRRVDAGVSDENAVVTRVAR
jgi:hypothetical protein